MKWILNVKMSTANSALYGELGRYPLYVVRQVRIVKYFLKLYVEKDYNCILSSTMNTLRYEAENCNFVNWASKVRDLLQNTGFHEVWMYPSSVNINMFVPIFRTRIIDMYINNWRQDICSKSSLFLFKELKPDFERSEYINKMKCRSLRNILAKIRLSSHDLHIETGRHRNIDRNDRKCTLCQCNDIEDEYHFILICPMYALLRNQYIPRYYHRHPSMLKLTQLLNSTNVKVLNKLALFCRNAFKLRTNELNSLL